MPNQYEIHPRIKVALVMVALRPILCVPLLVTGFRHGRNEHLLMLQWRNAHGA